MFCICGSTESFGLLNYLGNAYHMLCGQWQQAPNRAIALAPTQQHPIFANMLGALGTPDPTTTLQAYRACALLGVPGPVVHHNQ
jgi:hypothetical protein